MNKNRIYNILGREFKWLFIRIFPLVLGSILLLRWVSLEYLPYDIYSTLTKVWDAGYIIFAAAAVNRYLLSSFQKIITRMIRHYSADEDQQKNITITVGLTRLFRYGVYIVAILLCANLFIDLSYFWNTIGSTFFILISFFIGLLTSSVLGNVIAYEALRQANIISRNDVVETKNNLFGSVVSRGPFFVKIRTPNKEIVSISNLDLTNNLVKNYSREAPFNIDIQVGLGYDVKKETAKKLLLEAAAKTNSVLSNPKPFVWFIELGSFAITYQLMVYIDQPQSAHALVDIKSQLIENVIDIFDKNNVEIISPVHTAMRFKDQNTANGYRRPRYKNTN
ncbi:mechanosensitive ion channel family protein [[Eubacterium] cellulosolvens]